ncbi:protein-methionine-sulfoxide reductase heme-binding subunit MsrQ [Celeribacter halophilus]|uniref:Protein-methionine-sulfoxide reductase heme-binding subunit MsrQ n=1 Tax=Celeribacter halophilus TaxID=576117 RepID=A0AAW7XVS6_9RHOB|nr:protein-methionine-sulfoxide reductase heme-binding subunit MsrQ [Celeribacter halophilus]MDO6458546.1 protein-methionine-sulfoxide reductase heme-binding subunit MsrQ [Celeribacter halophilus]MDO6725042.1 protein-methionine-sulfoxide reductase heme-binding subunit MsrQ [Celeribacter halophilus]
MIDRINRFMRQVPTWPLYVAAVIPPAWFFYAGVTGQLGVDPVKAMEHKIGLLGLQVLIASLCVTPLRRYAGLNMLKFRRALGLIGFFYIFLHLLVWVVLDVQIFSQIIADIYKRPYITIGMGAFVLMIPLAATSYNAAIRKLGRNWRKLHKLVYPALLLGGVHFVMLRKGWQIEPLLYLAAVVALLLLRVPVRQKITRWMSRESV